MGIPQFIGSLVEGHLGCFTVFFCFVFGFFRATPMAYGGSQARG